MMVDVPVVGKVGDRLTTYFRDFGSFDANISETKTGSFLLELDMTRPMREKFASKLTWLEKKQKEPSLPDLRKDARIIPANPHSTLTLADGTIQDCFVIDMSPSGVAVSAPTATADWNAVGRRRLHRSRHQAVAGWLRGQIRRALEPTRNGASADHAICS